MQLILSEADLQRMPSDLRRSLLQFIGGLDHALNGGAAEATPLGRTQATMLLREASFHRDGKILNALLKRLAHEDAVEPPTRHALEGALPGPSKKTLPRYLATLDRLTARIVKQRGAKLCHYRRAEDAYSIHPTTRKALRDIIPALARSGTLEEPLWEG